LLGQIYSYIKSVSAPFEIAEYLRSAKSPKLNLGCGQNIIAGWLNVDIQAMPRATKLDIARSWPFNQNTFDAILCEHSIEHVSKGAGIELLASSFHVLRPGAYLRVITPDLEWIASKAANSSSGPDDEYLAFLSGLLNKSIKSWHDAINVTFYEYGHKYIWSTGELCKVLEHAGFVDLVVGRAAEWKQDIFEGVEGHLKIAGPKLGPLEAFSIEARKPA